MAEIRCSSYVEPPRGRQLLPTSIRYQYRVGDEGHGDWPAPTTPSLFYFYDQEENMNHGKKSMFTKVKEKAKRWKHLLAKKRHGNNESPRLEGSLDEDEDDAGDDEEEEEEDPEYHGAPMYESEKAPDFYKDQAQQKPVTTQFKSTNKNPTTRVPDITNRELEMKQANDIDYSSTHINSKNMEGKEKIINGKKMSETVTDEIISPAYTLFSSVTKLIILKIQESKPQCELVVKQAWDKGISVKEYVLHKLEPKEEDRVLCQVITEVVSPRKSSIVELDDGNGNDGDNDNGGGKNVNQDFYSLLTKEELQGHGSS